MNKSIIKEVFYGNRGYKETLVFLKKDEKRLDKICELEDELREKLTPEQFDLHQSFVSLIDEGCVEETDYYFVEGFRLGLLIGIECMENN